MKCQECDGTGKSAIPGKRCFFCSGTGELCDKCGESIDACHCDDDDDDDESEDE